MWESSFPAATVLPIFLSYNIILLLLFIYIYSFLIKNELFKENINMLNHLIRIICVLYVFAKMLTKRTIYLYIYICLFRFIHIYLYLCLSIYQFLYLSFIIYILIYQYISFLSPLIRILHQIISRLFLLFTKSTLLHIKYVHIR